MPTKTISCYLYRVRIHFIYQEPPDKAYQFVKSKGDYYPKESFDKAYKRSSGFVFWANEQDICLVLTHHDGNAMAGTIAHELFHVVDNIFRDKGIKLTEESNEAYAYYLGWLMDQLCAFLKASEKITKLKSKITKLKKRVNTMKAKPAKSAIKKAINQFAKKDKKEDMKMIKAAVKKAKRK
jgi:hypothetical protein